MGFYICGVCNTRTEHNHLHDAAHGIPGTHMHNSERFICQQCGTVTHAYDPGAANFPFIFDKPES